MLRHKKYTPNITTEFVPVHEVALEYLNIAQYFYKLVVLHLSTIFYRDCENVPLNLVGNLKNLHADIMLLSI